MSLSMLATLVKPRSGETFGISCEAVGSNPDAVIDYYINGEPLDVVLQSLFIYLEGSNDC